MDVRTNPEGRSDRMKALNWKTLMALGLFVTELFLASSTAFSQGAASETAVVRLPQPTFNSDMSVEKALLERRSVRVYKDQPVTLAEVSQLLWAAQGITETQKGLRTAPSPRGAYLIKVYVLAGQVADLPPGMYLYQPKGHELMRVSGGDRKGDLFNAAGQAAIKAAPLALLLTGAKAGVQNPAWMYLEAGHVSENVYLEAVSLKLGTVAMAGFKVDEVRKALAVDAKEEPIYIMPVGRK
jgi:SagB-type dehydrogenase family enzyme